jgi:peptidoglycan/xylan/chitin deacetylase (PgdA/CDA1 family)
VGIKEREEIKMEILVTCLVSLIAALIIFTAIRSKKIRINDWLLLAVAEAEKQLQALENLYRETFGHELARFYRPPEGKFDRKSLAVAKKLGYHTAFWSLAYADWDNAKQPDPEKAKKLLCEHLHNGAVILLHPTSQTNADILDALLTKWEKEGYRFGSLTEFTEIEK